MKILKTREALIEGYWFVSDSHGKEWQKYSVVDDAGKIIYVTADTKNECEKFMLYMRGVYVVPEFYKAKVNQFWRKSKWRSR